MTRQPAFTGKASLVITNVAGPREQVALAGREMGGTIGWPPESGDLAMGVSIVSDAGGLRIGVLADASQRCGRAARGSPATVIRDQ
jgi:hypothetical protein